MSQLQAPVKLLSARTNLQLPDHILIWLQYIFIPLVLLIMRFYHSIKSIVILFVVAMVSSVRADDGGSSAYNFLNIPTSSHAFALGGSAPAVIDDDVTLVDQNPALLGPEIDRQIAFNYMMYMQSGNFAGLRYGMEAGERGAWAIGMRYLNYGSITRYDQNGFTDGSTFSPQDLVVEGTYSHDFTDRLRGGINMKMVYSNYDGRSAFALAADLGINYYDDEKDLSLSVVLKNAGGQLKRFYNTYDRLPIDLEFGYMQGIGTSPFSVAITATNLTRWKLPYYTHSTDGDSQQLEMKSGFFSDLFRHLIFGIQVAPSDKFYAALAYNYKTRTDMSSYSRNFLSGFSIGLGIRVSSFGVSLAYAMPHKAGSSLLLHLNLAIGELIGY